MNLKKFFFTPTTSLIFVIVGFIIVNIIFNYNVFWHELIFDRSSVGAVWGEVEVFEWLTEKFYRTIMTGGNPFGLVYGMLYPFKIHLGLTDAGNGLFFLFLRPFFSPHQSMAVVITLSQLAASLGMYLLLRRLHIKRSTSFIIGLAFGYTTFIMPRGGHLNYWCYFVFPWFYYCSMILFQAKNKMSQTIASLSIAFFFVLTLWLNFYYFVILCTSIGSFVIYFFVFRPKIVYRILIKFWLYGFLIFFFILLFLIPWFKGLYEVVFFDKIPKTEGWGGAIEFSSDLFGFFIPSVYNYFIYKYFTVELGYIIDHYLKFARGIFENFTYPGLIIIVSYFFYLFVFGKKTFQSVNQKIKPYLFTSLLFLVLTLGPFLHIFGHWGITVEEGIRIVVPLPYIIFHYIPFLQNIRVPGRLIVGFIFCAYIVTAYVIDYFLKKKSQRVKKVFFILLLAIFFIDHRYINNIFPEAKFYPRRLFQEIKNDPARVSVLEIPFVVRDGFIYFGDGDAVTMTIGEALHGKNVLGGYTGRIADYKKTYYRVNPLLGFFGRFIDQTIETNPTIDKNDLVNWHTIDIAESQKTIAFLDLKYVILDEKKVYASTMSAILSDLGFKKQSSEQTFSLWQKNLTPKEFLSITMDGKNDVTFLGSGWHEEENNSRWAGKNSYVMFKIAKKRKLDLYFEAYAFYQRQSVTIYVNQKKVAKVSLSTDMKEYIVPVDKEWLENINTVHFIFKKAFQPKKIIAGSVDERNLSAGFTKIYLSETK